MNLLIIFAISITISFAIASIELSIRKHKEAIEGEE